MEKFLPLELSVGYSLNWYFFREKLSRQNREIKSKQYFLEFYYRDYTNRALIFVI